MTQSLARRRAIIVGAGQAGLATAAALIAKGMEPQRDFLVIDSSEGGRRWESRWHSLKLLSDARRSALRGYPMSGDQHRHPTAYEVTDYLRSVEEALQVRPVWGIRATGVKNLGYGSSIVLETEAGDVQTRNIVCATGAAARPNIPIWAPALNPRGPVLHSSQYLYPHQIPPGDVLIVGGGNAGVQLARELSPSHAVTLSVRTARRSRPRSSYTSVAGGRDGWLSRHAKSEPLLTDSYAALERAGVVLAPGVASAGGKEVVFTDGTARTVTSVLLATGFGPGDDWVPMHVRVTRARRTMTAIPGLFLVGFPRHGSRHADTIHGVWRDARAAAQHILARP
ncbi:MAG: pyridine nucleotide-disulfide oxidoreductase [Micrococcales bacterium 73-13]|nr:MAG: pyridine nucleotide-disulfide oxidoreductase [Micrococcales bacterium 73-13]